jgi:RNA-directed DNA polymerase
MAKQMIQIVNPPAAMPEDKPCANAAIRSTENWETINWEYHTGIVRKLQLRIAKATELKKFRKVKHLQWVLVHSLSAKFLAVRDVMQNSGSKTSGVDGITIKSPEEKLALAKSLTRKNYNASPLRRIYIPKAGSKKKLRPISIPTIYDRAQQALYTQALLPVSEATADINSYGFRPQRNCADAIAQCFNVLARQISPQYILEADISGCFDNISHEWMLRNLCTDKIMLAQWLKAGFVDMDKLLPTTVGAAQGGIISPTLCNMVLDGIAHMLKSNFKRHKGINFIRYADDCVP